MNAWIAIAIAVPLALLLACLSGSARAHLLPLLPVAPLPALLAALFAPEGVPMRIGNAEFALVFVVDRPGAVLLGVAALLWIAAGVYALGEDHRRHVGAFVTGWLMALTGCIGVFLAADVVGFYFLLAVLSVGASLLVLRGEGALAARAAAIYLGIALLAEAFLLAALVLIVQASPDGSLMISDAPAALASSPARDLTLTLLIVGLGVKAGLVPFHFWMPLAYGAAPIPAAAVMSGAVVKASVLAFIRFVPFDSALSGFGMALAAIGMIGAFHGVAIGITQTNAKVVLAYSSVSQMGFIVALIGMGMASGNTGTPLVVAFYAAHHLLVKGALFLAVGVASRSAQSLWVTMIPAGVIALGLGGLPLSGGFLAKYASKALMGDGVMATLAIASSVTTSLLMAHFLRRLANAPATGQASAPTLSAAWLAMAAASVFVPWWLYATIPIGAPSATLGLASLWSSLWPVLVGVVVALVLARGARTLPEVPAGDVGASLLAFERLGARVAVACERAEAVVRRWQVASVALLLVAAAFYWTLRA